MKKFWVDSDVNIRTKGISYNLTPSLIAKNTFFYLQSAGHFYCDRDYFTRREGYKSYLAIYTVSGKGYAVYRGKRYELSKGQVLFMDCYDFQEYRSDPEDRWEIKWAHFNGSTSREYFDAVYERHGPVIDMGENKRVAECLDEILKLASGSGDFQLEVKESCLVVELLTELLLAAPQKGEGRGPVVTDINILNSIAYVENNYEREVSLKDMAAAACSSVYHFSRLFRKATGYSPYEYLVKYRLNAAKNLLKTTGSTVEEIAGRVGFSSASNFIRTFRDLEGLTPLKYRRYFREGGGKAHA